MTSTSYAVWIHTQLEPTSVLITGKQKRDAPSWVAKNKSIDDMIASMGIEEYRRRVAEDKQREENEFYY